MLITFFLNIYYVFNILIKMLSLIISRVFISKKIELNFTFINFKLYTQLL